MKTLYFECKMGAAGDMLMAALYEICDQKELFLQTMNQAFSEYGIQISAEESKKCGISGTHMHVMINGEEEGVHVHEHVHTHTHDHTEAEHVHTNEHETAEHHHDESSHAHTHHSYQSVLAQIEHLQLPAQVKADAAAIYRLIGEAESAVHNTTLEQIHFHEVGTLDALADVCGCAFLMHLIAPEKSICVAAPCRKRICKMRPRHPPGSGSCDCGTFKRNPFLYRFHQRRTSDANRCCYPSSLCGKF